MTAKAYLLAGLLLAGSGCLGPGGPTPPGEGEDDTVAASEVVLEGARFRTEAGDLTMVFYPDDAPETVALYRAYLHEGYFVGREFARIVPGHVIQILDHVGAAGSTATEDPRRVPLEPSPRLNFSMGAVGISRYEDPNSGGPEFFIMDYATSHLWGNYTIFGQLVDEASIEVVHAVARMPAVDTPRVHPAVNGIVNDRTALDPVRITAAEAISITLPAEEAARLPPRVGQNVRVGDLRVSLEWPADLRTGEASGLTWFLRPYNGTAAPEPARLTMRVEGPEQAGGGAEAPELRPHPQYHEILRWAWTPRAAGQHTAVLQVDGRDVAAIAIAVEH